MGSGMRWTSTGPTWSEHSPIDRTSTRSCSAEGSIDARRRHHASTKKGKEGPMAAEEHNYKIIAFAVYPGLTLFDLAGPLGVVVGVSRLAPEFRTVVVGESVE